jgi:hypothetical protein
MVILQRRQEREQRELEMKRNAPKLNPTSQKIVREKELVAGGPIHPIDRLSRPIGSVKKSTLDGIEKPTFAPKILKKSSQLAAKGQRYPSDGDSGPRPGVHYDGSDGLHVGSEDEGARHYDSGDSRSRERSDSNEMVYKRSLMWAQEREQRIEIDRIRRSEEMLRDCTFRPQINGEIATDGLVASDRGRPRHAGNYSDLELDGQDRDGFGDDLSAGRFTHNADVAARQESWARKRYCCFVY